MPAKFTTGFVTQPLGTASTTQRHQLELCGSLDDGGEAIYVLADESIDPYGMALVGSGGKAYYANTSLASNYRRGGWAQVTLKSGEYGWLQMSGRPRAKVAASCANAVPLFLTTTDGVIDDATTSLAVGLIIGAVLDTTSIGVSNATAATLNVGRGQAIGFNQTA